MSCDDVDTKMSEYIITKRTECDMCHGKPMHRFGAPLTCLECMGAGYTEQCVADADEWLLSRLAKLRWDEKWDEYSGTTKEMTNPRFEENK